MRQIINAFQYIHKLKIIHRDIKLDNILLNYETEEDKNNLNLMKASVKIIDFGFSCVISKSGLQYSTLGSPINMDPIILKKLNSSGQTRQLGYSQKADIWSLGTICYEMLIGKSAFDAQDMDELVEKIEKGTYVIPTSVSKEVISFLNGMLQYESSKRLNSGQLAKHNFLTKDIKDFHKIDVK
jgi:serine/threonine protein kinase